MALSHPDRVGEGAAGNEEDSGRAIRNAYCGAFPASFPAVVTRYRY
jgi:hypothetical protein